MLFKNNPMQVEIENVDIHVRLLVEHRIYEDKKKKINKTEEDIMTSKSIGSVRISKKIC
jgi:hypothetical protein